MVYSNLKIYFIVCAGVLHLVYFEVSMLENTLETLSSNLIGMEQSYVWLCK
jgi:hypothetical protein